MDIKNIDFSDSVLLNIRVSYNEIVLSIRLDDGKDTEISLCCYGVVGLDNLVIWDDTDISKLRVVDADQNGAFMKQVHAAYDAFKDLGFGDKSLTDPIKDLQITLSNNITFHTYCQSILVSDEVSKRSVVDKFLSAIRGSKMDDYWYDVALDNLHLMLKQFTSNDWKALLDQIPLQSKTDNECLADCLENIDDKKAKKCVKKLKKF